MLLNRLEYALMNNPVRALLQRQVEAGAERVDAFDLDPRMVAQAQRRLRARGARVRLWTGDTTRIPAPDATYDAVFDFGIIHHIPQWRRALAEVARVLRPGGRFYAEEVLRDRGSFRLVRSGSA